MASSVSEVSSKIKQTDLARDEWMAAGHACGLALSGGGGRGGGRGYMNMKIKTDRKGGRNICTENKNN